MLHPAPTYHVLHRVHRHGPALTRRHSAPSPSRAPPSAYDIRVARAFWLRRSSRRRSPSRLKVQRAGSLPPVTRGSSSTGDFAAASRGTNLYCVIWPSSSSKNAALAGNCEPEQLSAMTDRPNIKADARDLVDHLPESATWDDLAYEVYVRQAIEAGLADSDAGRTLSHDEAMARIRSRIRRAS